MAGVGSGNGLPFWDRGHGQAMVILRHGSSRNNVRRSGLETGYFVLSSRK